MERKVKILAALLGLQVAAALVFNLNSNSFSPAASSAQLLNFDTAAIDNIQLWGPDGEELQLRKTAEGWRLPALNDFPADGRRVEQLLDKLHQLESGPAVARSRDAQKRFKVSEQSFERKLTLAAGNTEAATLYLGTTPGMRRIHARVADADAIHRVELAAYDVPLDRESWQNNTLLQFPRDEVAAITVGDLELQREKDTGTWLASRGLKENEQVDTDGVDELARLFAELRVGRVIDTESTAVAALEEPVLEVDVTRSNGNVISYQLGKSSDDEQYVLKVSTRSEYFHLPTFRAEPLLESSTRDALVKSESPAEEEDAAANDSAQSELEDAA